MRWVKPDQKLGRFKPAFSVDLPAMGSTLGYLDYNLFLPRDSQTQANARLRFSGGDLLAVIEQPVTASGIIYRLYPSPVSFTLSSTADGLFTGTFLDPASNRVRRFRGAILTKQQTAAGFFLGDQTGGLMELIPGFQ